MVRKCQKLAKSPSLRKPGDPFVFQTVVAPPDFRVKEMEKWFKEQQKRTNALLRLPHAHSIAVGPSRSCPQCTQRTDLRKNPIIDKSNNLTLSQRHRSTSAKAINDRHPNPQQPRSTPNPAALSLRPEKPSALTHPSKTGNLVAPPSIRSVSSPPPLPHLLRIRNLETGYDMSDDPQRVVSVPLNLPQSDPLSVTDNPPLTPEPQRPLLTRRRSCIKRSSIGDFSKTVSWADNQDLAEQVSRYASLAREAQASG